MSIGRNAVRMDLPNTLTALYTTLPHTRFDVRSITGVNRGSSDAKWELYIVGTGDTPGDDNVLIPATDGWAIPGGKNIDYETWKILSAGEVIWGRSYGSITIHIDGALVKA